MLADVKAWQSRPIEDLNPILCLDSLIVKISHGGAVRNRACYVPVGVNLDGEHVVLGLWFQATEGANFWLSCRLSSSSVAPRRFVCCVDRLKGFPEVIDAVFPQT